ncbi:YqiA/YcfP family alpha/beta fold hydrolase [Paraglaciecola sp. 20A4]|uniref:YqiA/YcfP family alpha/beta fold hydrolase n=1 Tax=Paraglaciecola sp. 20A4 TaxID=2687288 RepID=UPI00140DBC5D|nr:YqiA/YcfP family alpha/beta fold hydrolase [Paraglaciecola sp. 20A4]
MKVYFSHGKESGPWGSKIKRLAGIAKSHNCVVDSVDYSGIHDPDLRVEHLVNILKDEIDDFILVGSSMGGYVSLVAAEKVQPKGVFLLAPALYIEGYRQQSYNVSSNIEIVHGWSDDICPINNSIKFATAANCPLHLIPGDHRLNSSINIVEGLFSLYLTSY